MAIIPSSTRFVGIAPSVNLTEKKSNQLNSETQPYTMQDIIDTASSPPAGTAGQIQFSDGSAFAADPGLFWDNTNKRFFVSGTVVNAAFYNSGQTYDPANPANDFVFGPRTLRVAGNGLFIDNFDGASNTALSFGEGQATKMSFYYQPVGGNPGLTMRNNYAGNTMMRWNRANNYLSINDYNSSAQLYVKSSGSTSATTSLLVQNSGSTTALKVRDDLVTAFGGGADGGNGIRIVPGNNSEIIFTQGVDRVRLQRTGADSLAIYPGSSTVTYIKNGICNDGSNANFWMFENEVVTPVSIDNTKYLKIRINGVLYKLAVCV